MFPKQISAFVLGVLCSVVSVNAQADEATFNRVMKTKTINCGYFIWPPYITKDANTGEFSGINYDIMEAIGRNLGLKINWAAEVGSGDVVAALASNKADVMCASLWPSPARNAAMTFTTPLFFDEVFAFVRTDDKRFDGDLSKANSKSIKVTGIDGDVTAEMAVEKLPKATRVFLPQTASAAEMLNYLTTKKADVALLDPSIVADFSKNNPGKIRKVSKVNAIRVMSEHLAVRAGEYHLRDMMNVSLEQLVNDGTIEAITSKYSKQYQTNFMAPAKNFVAR